MGEAWERQGEAQGEARERHRERYGRIGRGMGES
jgi:hypothetical protein